MLSPPRLLALFFKLGCSSPPRNEDGDFFFFFRASFPPNLWRCWELLFPWKPARQPHGGGVGRPPQPLRLRSLAPARRGPKLRIIPLPTSPTGLQTEQGLCLVSDWPGTSTEQAKRRWGCWIQAGQASGSHGIFPSQTTNEGPPQPPQPETSPRAEGFFVLLCFIKILQSSHLSLVWGWEWRSPRFSRHSIRIPQGPGIQKVNDKTHQKNKISKTLCNSGEKKN